MTFTLILMLNVFGINSSTNVSTFNNKSTCMEIGNKIKSTNELITFECKQNNK